jgi:mannose/fructose/N-acetylgalactosamine-specific phosphotransferase system component IIC
VSLEVVALVAWGTFVAVDLVTVPQGLFSRPLVAATVAGWLAGDVGSGLLAGTALELYALEVLPIGAARYPDWGPAAVGGGMAAAWAPAGLELGLAGLVAMPLAILGGWTLHMHRRRNAQSVLGRMARVDAGDARAIWELQRNGLVRDAGRGVVLSVAALGAAATISELRWADFPDAAMLSWAVLAGGLAAAVSGAVRSAGAGNRRRWLTVGLATGLVAVLLR